MRQYVWVILGYGYGYMDTPRAHAKRIYASLLNEYFTRMQYINGCTSMFNVISF